MEADWEVEMGPDAPIIDATWPGYIDLAREPHRVREIAETSSLQPLSDALILLNGQVDANPGMPIRTLKCDLWPTNDLDPDEMEAIDCAVGIACYIDLLPRPVETFFSLSSAELWVRRLVPLIRNVPCPSSRVDLIIRQAIGLHTEGCGITAYLCGCGTTLDHAHESLGNALRVFATTVTTGGSATVIPSPSIRKAIQ